MKETAIFSHCDINPWATNLNMVCDTSSHWSGALWQVIGTSHYNKSIGSDTYLTFVYTDIDLKASDTERALPVV